MSLDNYGNGIRLDLPLKTKQLLTFNFYIYILPELKYIAKGQCVIRIN